VLFEHDCLHLSIQVWDDDGVIAHVLIASYHHLIGKEVEVM
jgi:hypothetical protein